MIFTLKQQARPVILLQKNFKQNCNMTTYACIFLAKFFKRKKKCGAHGFTSNKNLIFFFKKKNVPYGMPYNLTSPPSQKVTNRSI